MALLKGGSLASLGVLGTMSTMTRLKQHAPLALSSPQGEMHREMQREMASRIAHEMRGFKLEHLRLTMKAADLGLAMVRQPYPYPYPYP